MVPMKTFVTPPARIASGGMVYCPVRRADTSIDACLSCESLDEVTTRPGACGEDQVVVRCAPPRDLRDTGAGWIG